MGQLEQFSANLENLLASNSYHRSKWSNADWRAEPGLKTGYYDDIWWNIGFFHILPLYQI